MAALKPHGAFSFVAGRWANPAWRLYDLILLSVALLHGGNGLRILIDDYVHSRFWRAITVSGLYTFGFVFLVLGALVILTFKG